jgi:CHAD domain-containing protein
VTGPDRHPLGQLTQRVIEHGQRLVDDYQVTDLHQLRVHIRRIRSLMKYVPGCRDRALRAAWRELFVATNPARDWDVFLVSSRSLLPGPAADQLEEALRSIVRPLHQRVAGMLVSERWHQHLLEWREFLHILEDQPLQVPESVLPEVLDQARRARETALREGDRAAWHRLRIAVKNLRYVTDAIQQTGVASDQLAALVESCKLVQDLLGDWHDCIVQLELIEAPAVSRSLANLPRAAQIRACLDTGLDRRSAELLVRAGLALEELVLESRVLSGQPD